MCTNCYPYYSTSVYKKLNYWITKGEEEEELDTIDTWKSTPNYRDTPSLLVNIDVGTNREISGIFQPATMLCHRSVKLDSAKLYVDILVSHEIRMKN